MSIQLQKIYEPLIAGITRIASKRLRYDASVQLVFIDIANNILPGFLHMLLESLPQRL